MRPDITELAGRPENLRIAFVIGTLGQGGAEKQCLYMIRSLLEAGAYVDAYCIGRNEIHEASLRQLGVAPKWIGRFAVPPVRLATLVSCLIRTRPHVVQAAHTYVNLYAAAAASIVGAVSIGAVRSNVPGCLQSYGRWMPALMRMPSAVVVNSRAAIRQLSASPQLCPRRMFFVPNAIDLRDFDRKTSVPENVLDAAPADFARRNGMFTAITVARLVAVKRVDLFLRALAILRSRGERVRGIVVGDGPEKSRLQQLAVDLGLGAEHVWFAGASTEVHRFLAASNALVFCSDDLEGFPNTILEGMAARLAVVSTRAGDAEELVTDGVSGHLVPFDSGDAIADRLSALARHAAAAGRMGECARSRVEHAFDLSVLRSNLLGVYGALSFELGKRNLQRSLRKSALNGDTL